MHKIFMNVIFAVVIMSAFSKAEAFSEVHPGISEEVKVILLDDSEFFKIASRFYEKLGSTELVDIQSVSIHLAGAPSDKVAISTDSSLSVWGKPKLFFLTTLPAVGQNGSSVLLCAIYPPQSFGGKVEIETAENGWIQGRRRFDQWRKTDGVWKVKLDVDLRPEGGADGQGDTSLLVFETASEAKQALETGFTHERETHAALEKAIIGK